MREKLINICTPKQWKTLSSSDLKDEGYTVYGANGVIGYYSEYNHESETVMVTCRGATCGTVNISKPYSYINGNAMCMDDLRHDIEVKYLYYALKHYDFREVISGSAQPQITRQGLNNVFVEVVDKSKQIEIVKVLSNIEETILRKQQQISDYDQLIKSRFVEMFGDPISNSKKISVIELGKACNLKAGKFKSASDIQDDSYENSFKCYGGNGLRGYVDSYTHEGEMVLVGRQGALCGNVHFVNGMFHATEHAIVVQPITGWNPVWLFIMLREMNLNRFATGAAQPGLNVGTLTPLEVINPDVLFQNQFASFVIQIDKLKFAQLK